MQSDCIRLLVAHNLRLGQPLRTHLPLTDAARDRVIDSTCQAWQQIQSLAVDRAVDAVILNGRTLPIDDLSAEAEHALREGCALLHEAGIRVVLHPGENEHRLFWREFLAADHDLAKGVSLLAGTIPLPLSSHSHEALETDEQVVCRLVSIQDGILPESPDPHDRFHPERAPFTIGLHSHGRTTNSLPPGIELLVSGGSASWTRAYDATVQHCLCSVPQPLSHAEIASELATGCLLVEVHASGEVSVERRPTASIRFMECSLDLAACRDWDDAALQMQNQIETLPWCDLERVRLINWSLASADSMSLQVLDGPGAEHLITAWSHSFPLEDDLQVVHAFHSVNHAPSQWITPRTSNDTKELAAALFEQELSGENHRLERLREEWSTDEHSSQLWTRLNPHLNHAQISRQAEALMSHWLITSDPENLPYETHIP